MMTVLVLFSFLGELSL